MQTRGVYGVLGGNLKEVKKIRKYGMPYKGSKSKIAEQILNVLPDAEWFCDLFGGGGAITHCAALSFKYRYVLYNEIEPLVYKAFKMAVNGDFKNESRWISREDFFRLKDSDPYAAICFSFGNDLKTYAYSKELEAWKRALHYARKHYDYTKLAEFGIKSNGSRRDIKKHKDEYRKLYAHWLGNSYQCPDEFERCQSLENLQSLERLENLKRLENLDYEKVEIPDNAVIYCDIPYKSTNTYLSTFNHERFYEWALMQKQDVFISEYDMPEDFCIVAEFDRTSLLSPNSRETLKERLYCNHKYETEKQLSLWEE